MVIDCVEALGDHEVTVHFEGDVGVKRLLLSFARLEKVVGIGAIRIFLNQDFQDILNPVRPLILIQTIASLTPIGVGVDYRRRFTVTS